MKKLQRRLSLTFKDARTKKDSCNKRLQRRKTDMVAFAESYDFDTQTTGVVLESSVSSFDQQGYNHFSKSSRKSRSNKYLLQKSESFSHFEDHSHTSQAGYKFTADGVPILNEPELLSLNMSKKAQKLLGLNERGEDISRKNKRPNARRKTWFGAL
eukprot:snap_masked-scaffold_15-processed-gene-9.6-mRNA-1 protein AED:0.11 eAED:1.00 QI:0/-1/0/1/-1/1/1/0/155